MCKVYRNIHSVFFICLHILFILYHFWTIALWSWRSGRRSLFRARVPLKQYLVGVMWMCASAVLTTAPEHRIPEIKCGNAHIYIHSCNQCGHSLCHHIGGGGNMQKNKSFVMRSRIMVICVLSQAKRLHLVTAMRCMAESKRRSPVAPFPPFVAHVVTSQKDIRDAAGWWRRPREKKETKAHWR